MSAFHPLCFHSNRQYQQWQKAAARSGEADHLHHSGYCTDCTPEYQSEMIRQFRCKHPGTTFKHDADGMIEGTRYRKPA